LDRFGLISGSVLLNFWTSFGQFLDHFWCPFLAPILVPISGTDQTKIMEIVTIGRRSVPKMGTKIGAKNGHQYGPEIHQNWSRNDPKLVQKWSKTRPEIIQIHIFVGLGSIPIVANRTAADPLRNLLSRSKAEKCALPCCCSGLFLSSETHKP
jgi:hypothetical protein